LSQGRTVIYLKVSAASFNMKSSGLRLPCVAVVRILFRSTAVFQA
jgi:hypothetical protein